MSVYVWCVYSFTYIAKGKEAYERKKNNEKKKNGNKAHVKYWCRNSPEGSYPKSWSNCALPEVKPHYDELMDGFPCTGKENVNGGRTGWRYFSFSSRSSFSVCLIQQGVEAETDRILTLCMVIKGRNMVQEEKRKNGSQGSKQKAEG